MIRSVQQCDNKDMKIRKGSLSEFTLLALEKAVDGYLRFDDLLHKPKYYAYGDGWDKPLNKSDFSQALKRLREKGLIEYQQNKTNQLVIRLTNLGKDALGDLAGLEQEWDGRYRIVVFDVPEQKRAVRDLFRRRLRDWEFIPWQKSVWVGKKNVTDKLRKLINKLEIQEWVAVVESDDSILTTLFKRSLN